MSRLLYRVVFPTVYCTLQAFQGCNTCGWQPREVSVARFVRKRMQISAATPELEDASWIFTLPVCSSVLPLGVPRRGRRAREACKIGGTSLRCAKFARRSHESDGDDEFPRTANERQWN